MNRFDGNTILIAEGDRVFGTQLAEVLSFKGATCFYAEDLENAQKLFGKYDFDLVISNYYLSDGVIHQMIDWCSENLQTLPIFTCIGYPLAGDCELSQKHSIADVFSKNDPRRILSGLSKLLFDFNQFHESLLEMISPTEVLIEIQVGISSFIVRPIELNNDSMYVHVDRQFARGTFGVLKFSLGQDENSQNFIIPGFFEGKFSEGQVFRINRKYISNWLKFLAFLDDKQMKITCFMNKAAGL
jgi:hypothetical protein